MASNGQSDTDIDGRQGIVMIQAEVSNARSGR